MQNFKYDWIRAYIGGGYHWLLFILSLALLAIYIRNVYKVRLCLAYCALFFVIYLCPITAGIISKYCIEENVYWRMFWLLPAYIIIAYAIALLLNKITDRKKYIGAVTVIVFILAFMGTSIYGKGQYLIDNTGFKIPNKVLVSCNIMADNLYEGESIQAVGSYDFMCYMRLYNPEILQPYGRYGADSGAGQIIQEELSKDKVDSARLVEACREAKVNFIICKISSVDKEDLEALGYKVIGAVEDNYIFKLVV